MQRSSLEGVCEQVGLEADGVVDPSDAYSGRGVVTTIEGDSFSVRSPGGTLLLAGRLELEGTREITWIDSIGEDAGKRLPAIYRIEGDELVFVAGNQGEPRPTEFRTTIGQTMRRFVRRGETFAGRV